MKSVLAEYVEYCAFCGKPAEAEHHLIFGIGMRGLAEEDGLKLPACNSCHNMGAKSERIHGNPMAEKLSKMLGQIAWEKEYYKGLLEEKQDPARETFRQRYKRSYL